MPSPADLPAFLQPFVQTFDKPEAIDAFRAALTRKAWLQEHNSDSPHHHEPLEWLGDRMLEAVVAKELWRRFPYADPKRLDAARQALCSEPLLTRIGEDLGLLAYIRRGRGELLQQQVRAGKGLSDHLEAVLGAAFLAAGLEGVEVLVRSWWSAHWPERLVAKVSDASSELNELVTGIWGESLPKSSWSIGGDGPFCATVNLPDGTSFKGQSHSRIKGAKASAALAALPHLRAQRGVRKEG